MPLQSFCTKRKATKTRNQSSANLHATGLSDKCVKIPKTRKT